MVITGGYTRLGNTSKGLSSVEMFYPNNQSLSLTCILPNMTVDRYNHASNGLTVCGGGDDGLDSCESLISDKWRESHSLGYNRSDHVMWRTENNRTIIMGGYYSGTEDTTEILDEDSDGWRLQHDTE